MKINQLKAGVLLSYLSVGIGALVSIIYTPIMLRLLGQSEYGLYTLAGSVVSYLSILNFGLSSSYIRFYSKYKVNNDREGIAKLNGMFITVFFFLSLVAFIAGMILVLNTGNMFSAKLSASEIKITQKLIFVAIVLSIRVFDLNAYSFFLRFHFKNTQRTKIPPRKLKKITEKEKINNLRLNFTHLFDSPIH